MRVELNPEMERQLAAEALARGIALELYAQRLLQKAMASRSERRSRTSQEEFRIFLDALASKAPNVPQLRPETFSREMIYGVVAQCPDRPATCFRERSAWCVLARIHAEARRGPNRGIAGTLTSKLFGINANYSLGGSQWV